MALSREDDGTTTMRGLVTDQAALHGLLAKVRDIGATLTAGTSVTPDRLNEIGREITGLERLVNARLGLTEKDDTAFQEGIFLAGVVEPPVAGEGPERPPPRPASRCDNSTANPAATAGATTAAMRAERGK